MPAIHIEKKYLVKKRNQILAELFADGYSVTDIGTVLNIHKSWVCRLLRKGRDRNRK